MPQAATSNLGVRPTGRIRRLVPYLLLGLLLNVAIALASALAPGELVIDSYRRNALIPDGKGMVWRVTAMTKTRCDGVWQVGMREGDTTSWKALFSGQPQVTRPPYWCLVGSLPVPHVEEWMAERMDAAFGWPFRSMLATTKTIHSDVFTYTTTCIHGLALTPLARRLGWTPLSEFAPTRPIWPGFIANTLIYAAIFWLAFTLPRILRQDYRRRRNLCARCGYPGGVGAACPECGLARPDAT